MTKEEILEIMENDLNSDVYLDGDNAFKGLLILSKYTDNLIQAAEHDIIYSENIDVIIEIGITKDDVIELGKLNWMISEDAFACFV